MGRPAGFHTHITRLSGAGDRLGRDAFGGTGAMSDAMCVRAVSRVADARAPLGAGVISSRWRRILRNRGAPYSLACARCTFYLRSIYYDPHILHTYPHDNF